MRIAYVVEHFDERFGYIDNILPREFARLGHDVHVFTTFLPPYYSGTKGWAALADRSAEVEVDGFRVSRLPFRRIGKRILIKGLTHRLRFVRPDVVLNRGLASYVTAQVVWNRILRGHALFTSTGYSYLAFPADVRKAPRLTFKRLRHFLSRRLPGYVFSIFTERCIGSTEDCVDLAVDCFGVPRHKTTVISLGVDTDVFFPAETEAELARRRSVRTLLGVASEEILCIWTGRMVPEKNPVLLAAAVGELRNAGYAYRALFIGQGPEESRIRGCHGTILLPFMSWKELAPYYRAADLAVWPQSLTTSTLDAAASGLPIVMSDRERACERWQGNGVTYQEGSLASLKDVLLGLKNEEYRRELGGYGARKMRAFYNWRRIAEQFVELFQKGSRGKPHI